MQNGVLHYDVYISGQLLLMHRLRSILISSVLVEVGLILNASY